MLPAGYACAIRAPQKRGEMFCWIRKHEHSHAIDPTSGHAACGESQERWIEQGAVVPMTCPKCRAALGLGPLILQRGDAHYSLFLDYSPPPEKDGPHCQDRTGTAMAKAL